MMVGSLGDSTFCLDNLEEDYFKQQELNSYKLAYEHGRRAGLEEGHLLGSDEGKKLASEIGFYRGYAMTLIQMMELESETSPKLLMARRKLDEVLELVDAFPKTNDESCEQSLVEIRAKFKHGVSMLNITDFSP